MSALTEPATSAFAITPDDDTDLAVTPRALWTGAGGTIVCIMAGDAESITLTDVAAGCILPIRVKRVLETGTTASMGLVGLV